MERTTQNVELPATTRSLKYDYSGSLDSVKEQLAAEQTPGDGPFDTQGQARAAANSLLAQLGEDGKAFGARTVQRTDEADKDGKGGWYFGLKPGRKEYKGRKPAAEGDAKPRQSGGSGAKARS